jgi:hypothetical protein
MRKVIFNKWYLLATILTISLSTLSLVTYRKVRNVCSAGSSCPKGYGAEGRDQLLWDLVSRPLLPTAEVN